MRKLPLLAHSLLAAPRTVGLGEFLGAMEEAARQGRIGRSREGREGEKEEGREGEVVCGSFLCKLILCWQHCVRLS